MRYISKAFQSFLLVDVLWNILQILRVKSALHLNKENGGYFKKFSNDVMIWVITIYVRNIEFNAVLMKYALTKYF